MRVLRGWTFLFIAGIMWTGNSHSQDRSQTRSLVISRNGIVAAESPLAAQAGVRILEQGGNAVDAAIATNAMMGVVEPMMNGIGGDLFAIVLAKTSRQIRPQKTSRRFGGGDANRARGISGAGVGRRLLGGIGQLFAHR